MTRKRSLFEWIGDRMLEPVVVADVNRVSENFRFIDLESAAFRGAALRAGAKLQIDAGAWNFRTYTPVSLDPASGRLGILAYVHGNGPGARWAAGVRPGERLRARGPRRSLRLPESAHPWILFGDETSIAVAASLQRAGGGRIGRIVFEAAMPPEVASIAADLGLENVEVFRKAGDGEVPERALLAILEEARRPARLLLTGRAESIRRVRARLRAEGVPLSRVTSKAYWAEGKRGLD